MQKSAVLGRWIVQIENVQNVDEVFADANEDSVVLSYQWVTSEDKRARKLLQEYTNVEA